MSRKIIIADNHELSRYAMKSIIANYNLAIDNKTIIVEKADALRRELAQDEEAVVVIDMRNFDLLRTEDLVLMQDEHQKTRWIVFSGELSEILVRRLSAWTSFSFVLKECRIDEIVTALKLALAGERYYCHQIMDMLLAPERKDETEQLTQTEIEVLRLTAQGRTVKEIASIRNSSAHTITAHKRNIFRKIGVNTSYEATMVAARMGLIDLMEYYI